MENTAMFRFHLLAASPPEEISDSTVEKALMDITVEGEDDIRKICGILERARPELYKKISDRLTASRSK